MDTYALIKDALVGQVIQADYFNASDYARKHGFSEAVNCTEYDLLVGDGFVNRTFTRNGQPVAKRETTADSIRQLGIMSTDFDLRLIELESRN